MSSFIWTQIASHITQATGQKFVGKAQQSVGGGCINQAFAFTDNQRTYFVKLNDAVKLAMFEAEVMGLEEIYKTRTMGVPRPICWGAEAGSSYLVLEWLELTRSTTENWQAMGRQLAAMHQVTSEHGFGWQQQNTIGATPQINTWTLNWAEFCAEHRIGYQLKLANRRGGYFPAQAELLAAIPQLLSEHQPQPSLVHGDLWSGNVAFTASGEPVVLDPAVYFGDREVDLAMTELFGGFPQPFYQAYNQAWPLEPGYEQRKTLYNLYHILNHFNLFGGSYAAQANRMIEQILAFR
ncbi:MAG TPA: fructosamine kinase family protein [Candidatus Caenarcaniphilales bacterium]